MSIPSCSRDTARTLVERGVTSPVELSVLSISQCANLLVKDGEAVDEEDFLLAEKILFDAKTFADSLAKIEELEDKAILNIQ